MIEEVQQQEADEEEEEREEAIANPRPHEAIASDGTGSILTLVSLFPIRHLDFIELLNDEILILGFKQTQGFNVSKDVVVNGRTMPTQINVDKQGFTEAFKKDPANIKLADQVQERKDPKQLQKMKERLFNVYFDELERESKENVKPRKVQESEFHLQLRFDSKTRAKQVELALIQAKQECRIEAKNKKE
jgi:hypothetical protein